MAQVSIEFDLGLPNEYQVDHSQSAGKTRKFTYHGPDKIWLQLGADGKEKYGPLTEEDIVDGRPVPEDVAEWFEVDCSTDPLICQLRGPIDDAKQVEYDEPSTPHSQSPAIEGYDRLMVWTPAKPNDIYEASEVSKDLKTGKIVVKTRSVSEAICGTERDVTWEDIKLVRDKTLDASDNNLPADAPDALKAEWTAYRQKLRDMPTNLAGIDPNIATHMFPTQPSAATKYADAAAGKPDPE
jgi:hypothetical protein